MKFNLREKLHQAREGATATLAIGVLKADEAARDAIENLGKLGDRARAKANEVGNAASQKASDVRNAVTSTVDATKENIAKTTEGVKQKTVATLGQLGDKIEQKTSEAAKATKGFGKAARKKLNFSEAAKPKKVATIKAKPAKITATKKAQKPR
ncbi:MAG: hypothetical protein ACAH80_12790 [Alphaproteobacteria bacterium]